MSGFLVLMYHSIGDDGGSAKEARFTCSPRRFAWHLRLLRATGHRVARLGDLVEDLRLGRAVRPRTVALTFDDGFRNVRSDALPLLEAAKAPATVFVATDYVGGTNDWMVREGFRPQPMLDWRDTNAMRDAGIDFGGHSRSHPRLPELSEAKARAEIEGSKATLERALGVPVEHFAYPYGLAGERERRLVREAGFESACGIVEGLNRAGGDPFDLRRLEVRGTDSSARFLRKLWRAAARA